MKFTHTIVWIRPDGTGVDVSARLLNGGADGSKLTKGIGDPGQLFTILEGDVAMVFDDQDDFFRQEVAAANLRVERFTVDIVRDNTRLFRGSVLGEDLQFDSASRTVAFTVLGPVRLLSETSANVVRRNFGPMTVISPAFGPQDFLKISDSSADFRPGDLIRVSAGRSEEFRVRSFEPATSTLRIDPPLEQDRQIPAGAPVEVLTPFPRNELVADVVEALFVNSGVTDTDIQVEGGFGARPFSGPFQSEGLQDFGLPRGISYATDSGQRALRVVASQVSDGQQAVRQATSLTSGFVEATTGPFPPLSGSTISAASEHGGLFDQYDAGADPTSPLDFQFSFLGRMDYAVINGGLTSPSYQVRQSRWHGWPVNPVSGTGILWELRFEQDLDPLEVRGPKPDYENGARNWSTRLYRWTTANRGATWTLDGSFQGGVGYYTIQQVAQAPGIDRSPFFMPGQGVGREYLNPEMDWSISGQPDLGPAGVLYVTVQQSGFQDPIILRLVVTSGSTGIEPFGSGSTAILHTNAGSCKAIRLQSGAGGSYTELIWFDLQTNALVLDVDTWTGSAFVNSSLTSIGIGGNGINLRTVKWNGLNDGGSRIAGTFRTLNNGRGVGWFVLRTKESLGGYAFAVDGFASLALGRTREEEEARWLPAALTGNLPRPVNDEFLGLWLLADGTRLWASFVAGRYVVITNEVTGYASYFDFEDLSALEAIQQCAFFTNSVVKVETLVDGTVRGTFRAQENTSPLRVKVTDQFGGVPAGEPERLFRSRYTGSWVHSFNFVRVTGATDEVFADSGDPRYQLDGLELSCRLIESADLAQVLADTLLEFYGGARLAPEISMGVTLRGLTFGPFDCGYRLVATTASGVVLAVSPPAVIFDFNGTVTVRWDGAILQPQAVLCEVWRIFSGSDPVTPGFEDVGRIGVVSFSSGIFVDTDLPADIFGLPPTLTTLQSRQAAEFEVLEDGVTQWEPGTIIECEDLHQTVGESGAGSAPDWIVERVAVIQDSDIYTLECYRKELDE